MGQQPRALYEYEAPKTQPLGTGGDMHFAYSFAAQAAEVEVNTLTGEVQRSTSHRRQRCGHSRQPAWLAGTG